MPWPRRGRPSDGSSIELNARSRVRVVFDGNQRAVDVIDGAVRIHRGQVEEARLLAGMPLVGTTGPGRGERRAPGASVRSVDVAKVPAWRGGHVFLDDLTLDAAVAEMNKHSPVQIRLGDRSLSDLRIKGMFRAGQQEAFVAALEQSLAIVAVRRRDREIVVSARRQA